MIRLFDLFLLGAGIVEISLNQLLLLGRGQLSFILFENAFNTPPLGGGYPLQDMFFRLVALFQEIQLE